MSDWTAPPPSTPPTEPPGMPGGPPSARPPAPPSVPSSAAPPAPGAPTRGRGRTVIGVVLALVAGLSAVVGFASFWTTHEMLSSSTWESTSRAIVSDPTVQQEVASAISREIIDAVGLQSIVSGLLPGVLSGLSGTITDKATELLTDATVAVVRTKFFVDLWQSAVRTSHDQFVHAIDGSGGMTAITSRGIELDLAGVVTAVQKQLDQRGIRVLDSIDASKVDVKFLLIDAPGLDAMRTWVRVLRVLAIVLPAIAVIAAISALVVATRRWFAVVALGAGGLVGAAAVALALSVWRGGAIDELSGGVIGRSTATIVVDHITSGVDRVLLVTAGITLAVLVVGLVGSILTPSRRRAGSSSVDVA